MIYAPKMVHEMFMGDNMYCYEYQNDKYVRNTTVIWDNVVTK